MLLKNPITEDKTIWAGLNHPELPLEEADIAVFGIPYDGGVSFRSGTCEAPQELRKITHTISPTTEDFRDISSVKVKDLGDCVGKDRDEMFAEAEELAYQAVKAGKFFTMIGGDHSVTIPVHRGVNRAVEEDFGIIHIDAHFDLCHEMHGDILSHGSTERRATELSHVGDSDHLYFLGIRSIESDELEFYQNNKINVLSAADVDHLGVPAALERMVSHMKRFSKVYITLDIDCLDPAYAAGTGTPQFGGLTARQLLDLLKGLFDGLNIIGMDVVEVYAQTPYGDYEKQNRVEKAAVQFVGMGTQKLQEALEESYPGVEIMRMDADTITATQSHEVLLDRFRWKQVPILLGTQMVAKGLDFANVTLVGVVDGDLSLYADNYRAAERTFSLLTQVVGGGGRGEKLGRAVIQTWTPDNDVINLAARQDYDTFYEEEREMRRMLRFPPFLDLFRITLSGPEETQVLRACAVIRRSLEPWVKPRQQGPEGPEVLGPAPAPVLKVNNRYRYRVLLKCRNGREIRAVLAQILQAAQQDRANRGLSIAMDVNPMD